jgi:hypothetical protein
MPADLSLNQPLMLLLESKANSKSLAGRLTVRARNFEAFGILC